MEQDFEKLGTVQTGAHKMNSLFSHLPPSPHRFVRPPALPTNPARMIAGRLRRPESAIDVVFFGTAPFVVPNIYRRRAE